MRMVAKLVVKSEGCAEIDAVQNWIRRTNQVEQVQIDAISNSFRGLVPAQRTRPMAATATRSIFYSYSL